MLLIPLLLVLPLLLLPLPLLEVALSDVVCYAAARSTDTQLLGAHHGRCVECWDVGFQFELFPLNCTPILQPCDMNVNCEFQWVWTSCWLDWFITLGCSLPGYSSSLVSYGFTLLTLNALRTIPSSPLRSCYTADSSALTTVTTYGLVHLSSSLPDSAAGSCLVCSIKLSATGYCTSHLCGQRTSSASPARVLVLLWSLPISSSSLPPSVRSALDTHILTARLLLVQRPMQWID